RGVHPYEEIINTARDKGCDLIWMGSHGRKGLDRLLLGSQAQRVLSHSTLPVMVYR
ncbi:MAG: universal stress protein, partial [Burkholderiaceae bacterium]